MVGSHRFELRRARVDRLEDRTDPPGMSDVTDLFFTQAPQLRDLTVGESLPLGHDEEFAVQRFSGCERIGDLVDLTYVVEEPRIDAGRLVHRVDARPGPQPLLHQSQASIVGSLHSFQDVRHVDCVARGFPGKDSRRPLHRTQGLVQRLPKITTDGHRLANTLHRGGQGGIRSGEFLEGKAWDLHDDVVERWLERCRCLLRDVVGDLVECVTDRETCRDLGDGKAGRLRCEG